jgi:imidazolonepropionase-like amidohydrolase/Tol biopolymer transport system component
MKPLRLLGSALAVSVAVVGTLASPLTAQTPAQNDSAIKAAARTSALPLLTPRKLTFTTDEASWISLDVSPDGRTIVFDILGDLYTIPVAGGSATRITSGTGWDQQPRYSPDGKQIAFVSDRNGSKNLWIANADGTKPRILTKSERINFASPIWLADGQYVIAGRAGQLWMYNTNGGSGVQLTGLRAEGAAPAAGPGGATPSHYGAAPSNDPRYLWVNVTGGVPPTLAVGVPGANPDEIMSARDENEELAARSNARRIGQYQVAQFDRETGRTLVRSHETEGAFRPVASPDGKWLVYATRHDAREALKLRDLITGEERWLVMDVQRDNSQGGGVNDRDLYPGSAFTPDSKSLITSYNGRIWRVDVPSGTVTAIPFTAQVDQQMGALAKFEYPVNDSTLVVTQIRGAKPSPDGRLVAFTALDNLYVGELGPIPAAGDTARRTVTNPRKLTAGGMVEHAPVWSPDGGYIAYVTWTDTAGGHVYRIAAAGGTPERLTRLAAFYDKIAYTKDGSRLMAVRGSRFSRLRQFEDFGNISNGELEYVTIPAAGGDAARIAWTGSGQSQQGRNVPHVGPDSNRLYVWAGNDGLVSMRFDGTDRKIVVRVAGPPPPAQPLPPGAPPPPPPSPDEVLLSPDGKRALVLANNNVFMITVPPIVGVAPAIGVSGAGVPTTRLTRVGGDFIGWSNDGATAFYSIGRSIFRYDVGTAEAAIRDSVSRADSIANAAPAGGAGGGAGAGAGAGGAGAAGGAAARDTTKKPSMAYEARRFDVTITAAKDKPRGSVVLKGARIVTMNGDKVIEKGDVVVTDNRIAGVGPSGSVKVPAGAKVIDVGGKTIIPGYVDIHAHNWFGWGVHRDQVTQLLANLAYGVTTQRDPQTSATDILTYTDLMETGALIGPRLYSTGPGIFAADNIKSLDEARDVLRRYADHYNTKTIKQYMAGDRKVREWVIMAAKELGLTTTTEGGSNLTMNLTLMQDGYPGLEHAMPIFPLFKDVVQLEAQSGITYTPTLIVGYGGPIGRDYYLTHYNIDEDKKLHYFTPHDELDSWKSLTYNREDQYIFKGHAEQLAKMVKAGGRVGLGSHGELQGLGVHWELWMMQSGGLSNFETLRAATIHGADAIGLSKDLGSLEVGKLADLQVLDKNPLTDIHNTNSVKFVMKNGRLYDGNNLNEVWPRAKALPPQWWWNQDPPAKK